MRTIATIGVYEADLDSFLAALRAASVALLLDVRQRRGVRGREYAWANAQRLQAALTDAGIAYEHRKELAPTTELRQLQYARGRPPRRRQAVASPAGACLRGAVPPRDPRPGRPRRRRRMHARRRHDRVALRRARPRGLPPVTRRGGARRGVRLRRHPSASVAPRAPAPGVPAAAARRRPQSRPAARRATRTRAWRDLRALPAPRSGRRRRPSSRCSYGSGRSVIREPVGGVCVATVLAGQPAARERTERREAEPVLAAERQHVVLGAAVEQRVRVLRPAVGVAVLRSPCEAATRRRC